MPQITRKVISSEQIAGLRAEVEKHSRLDATMSVVLLTLDPFQRATDRQGAQPCFQPAAKTEDSQWFALAQDICVPADELESERDPIDDRFTPGYGSYIGGLSR